MKTAKSVLIVDDDPVFCRLMVHLLAGWGLEAESFTEPQKFLDRAKIVQPHLCLVDLNLGEPLKGFDIIALLRSSLPEVPVFIVSGSRDSKLVTQALEIGASDYLVKPIDREVLVSKLSRHLSTSELELARPAASSTRTAEIRTEISLSAEIVAVDELGITVLSSHLIAKGAKLRLSGPAAQAIVGRSTPVAITVLSAALDDSSGFFRTYFEFDPGDSALMEAVRGWIRARRAGRAEQGL